MQITANGAVHELAPNSTLADLLETLELGDRRVAIEVNEDLVPRSRHATHVLSDGDRIEIVHAIGGG